jgi:hypothetical protein
MTKTPNPAFEWDAAKARRPSTFTLGSNNMRFISTAVILVVFFAFATTASAVSPERAKGISMHMLPKRVADLGGKKWGLVVSFAENLKTERVEPVLQSTTEFLSYVRKQERSVRENGVWIVITHPDAYSESEKKVLEDIKALSRQENIPLFVARGSQLPNGWQRYDNAP